MTKLQKLDLTGMTDGDAFVEAFERILEPWVKSLSPTDSEPVESRTSEVATLAAITLRYLHDQENRRDLVEKLEPSMGNLFEGLSKDMHESTFDAMFNALATMYLVGYQDAIAPSTGDAKYRLPEFHFDLGKTELQNMKNELKANNPEKVARLIKSLLTNHKEFILMLSHWDENLPPEISGLRKSRTDELAAIASALGERIYYDAEQNPEKLAAYFMKMVQLTYIMGRTDERYK